MYAEDPARGLPAHRRRGAGLRERSAGRAGRLGLAAGTAVGPIDDPMLAKVIAWGDDRDEALHRLDHALAERRCSA